ncbi:RES family NAD+ phosphorylase [Paenibacillus sp. HW567]|uniref:RES family NAD+ phosphorylase n=1 Tax=Paenibacillus sp. HW567 TaxID=1034769 RepID=UPI00036A11D6|nr:RES family NAD+ phosphorylase [Paenibacillus sp. HW567]
MICCTECFQDVEVKSHIKDLKNKGNCYTCGCKNVFIYDTETNHLLTTWFEEFISIFTPVDALPLNFPRADLSLLKDELHDNWNIFNLEKEIIYKLITVICEERYRSNPELFDAPIGIPKSQQASYLQSNSLLKTYNWEDFVEAIKTQNRFHTDHLNEEVLQLFCSYVKKTYKAGSIFYRARVSDKEGWSVDKMSAPPPALASAGRANPEGISHLYLSNDVTTTLKEVRAGAHDYVTVGKFELIQDMDIVDLTAIDRISAFSDLDNTQHATNKRHLQKINREIAKPLRRQDSALDYLPTQYIVDFIKSIKTTEGTREYDGIEYDSTMNKSEGGFNITVFDEKLFKCTELSVIQIIELTYRPSRIVWDSVQ